MNLHFAYMNKLLSPRNRLVLHHSKSKQIRLLLLRGNFLRVRLRTILPTTHTHLEFITHLEHVHELFVFIAHCHVIGSGSLLTDLF